MLNKYQKAAEALILKQQASPLHLIKNRKGKPASWNDTHWAMSNLDGSKATFNFRIINNEAKPYLNIERHLLMCYVLHMRNRYGVKKANPQKLNSARHALARVSVFTLTQQDLNDLFVGVSHWHTFFKPFLDWLKDCGVASKALNAPASAREQSYDGDLSRKRREKNMPDERAMHAICAIRNDIIPTFVEKGVYQRSLRDHLIASSATLSIAAPQRSAKEQFVLPKSKLQSKMVTFKGKQHRVHWADWPGSKGYEANKKHIFKLAAEPSREILEFWNEAGEPARILCRFFEKPTLPLSKLLGDYQAANLAEFDVSKPIDNMFVLGYLLGFYEGVTQPVTLTPGHLKSRNKPTKKIQHLRLSDKVACGTQFKALLGVPAPNKHTKPSVNKIFHGILTIAQLQKKWIAYIKQEVPTFPMRIIGENKVKLSQALFIVTGAQVTGVSYTLSKSYYGIESVELGALVASGLRDNKSPTIFTRNGFSPCISLNAYQLRHWSNTMLQMSDGIPQFAIAMTSGRRDIRHNAEYDNQTSDDKMQPIHSLFTTEKTHEELKKEVRVLGQKSYEVATGKNATITSTGTCGQQLTVNPCTYLNDFETHCPLCSSSTHYAHDKAAILLLEDDIKTQKIRLKSVSNNEYLNVNERLQSWFKTHYRNTYVLDQLIELMKREDLEVGTAIKYVGSNNSFRLTDLKAKTIEEVKMLLPDSETVLQGLIESNKEPEVINECTQKLSELFTDFGIKEELV